MADSSVRRRKKKEITKPKKPYANFPLTPHGSGKWCKAIKGKIHYFGNWARRDKGKLVPVEKDGWEEALAEYEKQAEYLHTGRLPQTDEDLTVARLSNKFLIAKQNLLENGEIVQRTFNDYKRITDRLINEFGNRRRVDDLRAEDFDRLRKKISKTCGPVRLGGEILQTKMVFKFGYDAGLMDKPMRYGATFKPPSKKVLRIHRQKNGEKMFESAELQTLLDGAGVQMKAMILLALNCGYGNHDCGTLPRSAVDLKSGWIVFGRPKTGVDRRCPLWKETVQALKKVQKSQPDPKDEEHDGLFFVTKYGLPWAKENSSANPVSAEFRKLCKEVKAYRKGVGFYTLRHVFATIGGEAKDPDAVSALMGHADHSMAAVYRERISDERLRAVTNHVHGWLYPPKKKKKKSVNNL